MVGQPCTVDDVGSEILDAHHADERTNFEVLTVDGRLLDLAALDLRIDDLAGRLCRRWRRFLRPEAKQVLRGRAA